MGNESVLLYELPPRLYFYSALWCWRFWLSGPLNLLRRARERDTAIPFSGMTAAALLASTMATQIFFFSNLTEPSLGLARVEGGGAWQLFPPSPGHQHHPHAETVMTGHSLATYGVGPY